MFLVIISKDYQDDGDCKEEADTALRLTRKMIFAKAKTFTENEWMKNLTKDMRIFDLTSEAKYKKNMASLLDSVKLGSEVLFLNGRI